MGVLAFHDHAQHHHLSSSWVFLGFHDHPHVIFFMGLSRFHDHAHHDRLHLLHGFIQVS
jgi:hypothetical protein